VHDVTQLLDAIEGDDTPHFLESKKAQIDKRGILVGIPEELEHGFRGFGWIMTLAGWLAWPRFFLLSACTSSQTR
jgi:hypothetical protein